MKIQIQSRANRRNEEGIVAVIVMIALLGLVLAFIIANLHTLSDLHRELKLIEQKQTRRLNEFTTNAAPESPATAPANSPAQAKPLQD